MRRLIVLFVFAAGCAKSPTAPVRVVKEELVAPLVEAPLPPRHHNIPATFAGHPEGPLVYLCATQPRQYYDTEGRPVGVPEEDHYLQYEQCPAVPIE